MTAIFFYLARFQKHVFAFNVEIQDGHQNWRENVFYKNSKWPPFLARQKFLKIGFTTLHIRCGSKISSKSLYLAPFPR